MGNEWVLYSDSPLQTSLSRFANVTLRFGKSPPQSVTGLAYSQGIYCRWLKKDKADLFWSPRHHLPVLSDRKIPTVVTIHDVVWKRFPQTMSKPTFLLEMLLMRRSIARARKVICVSEFTKSEVAFFWPEFAAKCRVVYSGATSIPDNPEKYPQADKPYILFVGTMEPRKNLSRLLRAYSNLVEKGIEENLVIIGSQGWGNEQLLSVIQSLNIQERVKLAGFVRDEELDYMYRNARCLVMPSLYEGFGLPVVEAMKYGVPVVVSDTGSLPEIAANAGTYIDPFSIDSIEGGLTSILIDETRYRAMSRAASDRAVQFSWKRAGELTLKNLESAANA